jgi:hypothetical protein
MAKKKNNVAKGGKFDGHNERDYSKKKVMDNFEKSRQKKEKQAHSYVKPKVIRAGCEYEYRMAADEIKWLLINRKGADKNKDAQEYLCDYVNEQCGILGSCIRVTGC